MAVEHSGFGLPLSATRDSMFKSECLGPPGTNFSLFRLFLGGEPSQPKRSTRKGT